MTAVEHGDDMRSAGRDLVEQEAQGAVRITVSTDYLIRPAWLDRLAHKPFFRRLTEDLLKRSMRRFDAHLRYG